jgi:two-component system LytT family response regulator
VSQKGNKKGGIEPQQLEILMGLLKNTDKPPVKITIPTLEGFLFVPVADIIHCLGDTNYTHIHLKDGQKILSSKSLKVYEEMLAPHNFFRIHKSHLINMSYLTKYVKGEGGKVIMTDGSELEVSRRKKEEFLGKIGRSN